MLNLQRLLWEGDQEAVRRSGRDEPICIAIHMCMDVMLGISLYSYHYPKLAIMLMLSFHLSCVLSNKIGEQEG
jgi:hypothetical protein